MSGRGRNIETGVDVLHHPVEGRKFVIGTDSSLNGLGAVLQQREDGALYPIAFASRSLKPSEKNYSVPELEWRPYILGTPFDVETDKQSLTWLKTATAPSRLVRWALLLSEFDMTIIYRKGANNPVADALSRAFVVTRSRSRAARGSDLGGAVNAGADTERLMDRF